jgi:hypothetical protein
MSGLTIAVVHCGSVIESSRGAIIWPTNADHQERQPDPQRGETARQEPGTFLLARLNSMRTSNNNVFGPRGKPRKRPPPLPQIKSP